MTADKCAELCGAKKLCGEDREISSFFASDLLSHIIAKAKPESAIITVVANVNVLAVAKIKNAPCVIFADGIIPEKSVLQRAMDENITLYTAEIGTFEICGRIAAEQKVGKTQTETRNERNRT